MTSHHKIVIAISLTGSAGCTTTEHFFDVGIAVIAPVGADFSASEHEFVADGALHAGVDSGLFVHPCSDVEASCEIVVDDGAITITSEFVVTERNCQAGKTGPLPAESADCDSEAVSSGSYVVSYVGFEGSLTVPSTAPALRLGVVPP